MQLRALEKGWGSATVGSEAKFEDREEGRKRTGEIEKDQKS